MFIIIVFFLLFFFFFSHCVFILVHDTLLIKKLIVFLFEKPKVKGESPQLTDLFIFRCTLTTFLFPVLSRRQQKYKRQEKTIDLISWRNESKKLYVNECFCLIKEAWRRVLKDVGGVVLHKNHPVVFPHSCWTVRLPGGTAASIKISISIAIW